MTFRTLAWVFLASWAAVLFGDCTASAEEPDKVLRLARVLACEAWDSDPDHRAMLAVLERRRARLPAYAGLDIVQAAEAYSTCGRSRNPWARRVMALPEDDLPGEAITNAVMSIRALPMDRLDDPCEGEPMHWAAPELVPQRRRVECRGDNPRQHLVNAYAR